jgi:hypothetical protein
VGSEPGNGLAGAVTKSSSRFKVSGLKLDFGLSDLRLEFEAGNFVLIIRKTGLINDQACFVLSAFLIFRIAFPKPEVML